MIDDNIDPFKTLIHDFSLIDILIRREVKIKVIKDQNSITTKPSSWKLHLEGFRHKYLYKSFPFIIK